MSYQRDREYADSLNPEINRVLKACAHKIIQIEVASDEADKERATDFEIRVVGGTIAARVRRNCDFRDLTIRASRPTGVKTELEKIRKGYGDWYLYAWERHGQFEDWMLVCLKRVRQFGLLDEPGRIYNPSDGTSFLRIDAKKLHKYRCIKAASLGIQQYVGVRR